MSIGVAYRNLSPAYVADAWERWCGETSWSRGLRRLEGRATVDWWGGVPRSKSAIPLCFVIRLADGTEIRGSRLKDIRVALATVK